MTQNIKQGILFASLAALISGISIFYNKLVVVKGIDATIFNILKNGGAAIIISGLIIQTSSFKSFSLLSKKNWALLLTIAVIGGSIPFVLFFEGLKNVAAINANLIQKTLFIWVAILAIPILKERLTSIQIIGYLLIIASNFFIGGFKGFNANTAEAMILLATLLWSVENIIAKIALRTIDSKIVVWGRIFLGVLLLICYAAFSQKLGLIGKLTPEQILPISGSVILLTGYVLSWYKALSLAPVTMVTAILVLATPITNILSAVFITHTIDQTQLINIVLSIIGVFLIAFFVAKAVNYEQPRISPVR